jgi:hypothetical protein
MQNLPREVEAESSEPLNKSQRLGAHCLFEQARPFTTGPGKLCFQKKTVTTFQPMPGMQRCKPKLLSGVLQGNVH